MPRTQDQKACDFLALHEAEPFVIPNPWDAGSARVLEALGFKALATTSSGFAFTLGLDFPFLLTARAENHLRGHPDLADTVALASHSQIKEWLEG
ncbi:MAG TPA: isocitrate lyase/phosphoenolpyruvate mutase family protein [Solirubrobacteraceae bacterium]